MVYKKYGIFGLIVVGCIMHAYYYLPSLKKRFSPYITRITHPVRAAISRASDQARNWIKRNKPIIGLGVAAGVGLGPYYLHNYALERAGEKVIDEIANGIERNKDTYKKSVTIGSHEFEVTVTKRGADFAVSIQQWILTVPGGHDVVEVVGAIIDAFGELREHTYNNRLSLPRVLWDATLMKKKILQRLSELSAAR